MGSKYANKALGSSIESSSNEKTVDIVIPVAPSSSFTELKETFVTQEITVISDSESPADSWENQPSDMDSEPEDLEEHRAEVIDSIDESDTDMDLPSIERVENESSCTDSPKDTKVTRRKSERSNAGVPPKKFADFYHSS
ncbi:hypothetical protein BDB01DRAFT_880394 [Pilobolus umbonatus]|nr:hypothetical protein BDB01DRAFT_880394 [Pilobolus umbonatus]